VLHLDEVDSSRERAWRESVAVLDEGTHRSQVPSLFPEERISESQADASVVRLKA